MSKPEEKSEHHYTETLRDLFKHYYYALEILIY